MWLLVQVPLFRYLGDWVGDTGKEFGVPRDLLAGQLLYRDTFWPYGPFPAYLNAGLMGLFGTHADVLLVAARLLGLAVCLMVYRLVRRCSGQAGALAAAGTVLAVSGTSGFFATPYSFATLWACLLGLLGMECLLNAGQSRRPALWLLLAGTAGAGLLLAKFTVLLPLAIPALLAGWRLARSEGKLCFPRLLSLLACFAAPSLLVALPVYAWFAWRTGWDSFALQALGGFHRHNIRYGLLYPYLWRTMRLGNGHGFREVAAASLVWAVLALAAWGAATVRMAGRRQVPAWPAGLFALYACLNLSQMNSTVHVPYVFPAVLVAALWGTMLLEKAGPAWLRPLRYTALLFFLAIPLARLPLLLRKTMRLETASASLRFAEQPGRALARTVALVQAESPPGEPVGIFTGHDFLYQILDRPNRLGYYYTLYEPFWRPWAEERFLRRFHAADFRLLVVHTDESFSHAYILDIHQTRKRILGQLFANYEPISGDDCLPYVVWRRRAAPEKKHSK
jgi:hypothetical protein